MTKDRFNRSSRVLIALWVGMAISGCTVVGSLSPSGPRPSEPSSSEREAMPIEPTQPSSSSAEQEQVYGAAAVVELMKKARSFSAAGDSISAGATIERALRIEPHNPALWYNLAVNHYRLKGYDQCEYAGLKSLSFISTSHSLYSQNWSLIGECRAQRGDKAGAAKAKDRIK